MERRNRHPEAEEAVVDAWAYTCHGCGGMWRLRWTTPTDALGEHLYCRDCAPKKDDSAVELTWLSQLFNVAFWYCQRHGHVVDSWRCDGAPTGPTFVVTIKECARCGEPFTARRSDAVYCSTRCRVAAHRARSQDRSMTTP